MPFLRIFKCCLTLLAVVFILASGCRKQSTALSTEQSEVNQAFDLALAMKMFYGNYDLKTQTSVASLPKDKSSLPAAGEQQMTIRSLFNALSASLRPDRHHPHNLCGRTQLGRLRRRAPFQNEKLSSSSQWNVLWFRASLKDRSGPTKFYVADHITLLLWRPMLCGAGDAASPWDAREQPRTPHNF